MSYMVDGVRRALYGGNVPEALNVFLTTGSREWLVVAVFTVGTLQCGAVPAKGCIE